MDDRAIADRGLAATETAATPAPPAPADRIGALWLTAERLARHGGWFAVFLVLAPILGPRDYGLVAVALAGIAIVETMFAEVAADAIVALETVEPAHLSTAFLTNTGIGAAMSLLLYTVAGQFAVMSDDVGLSDIYQSLALLPVLSALTAVPIALLKRRRAFAPLAVASLVGVAAGGVAAIALAAVGGGAWSLVAQIVTQRFVEIMLLWGGAGQMIGLKWSRRHLADLAGALTPIVLTPALASVAQQMPRFLVGLILGPTAAGLYLLASRIVEALIDIVVAPPAIAARATVLSGGLAPASGPDATHQVGRAIRQESLAALPAILGSVALLERVIPAVVDPSWWGAVMPAQILILGAVPAMVQQARTVALLASGRIAAEARCAMLQTISGVIATALAVPYGLVAVGTVLLIHGIVTAALSLSPMRRVLGAGLRAAFAEAARPLSAAVGGGAAVLAIEGVPYPSFPPFVALALLGAGAALGYGLIMLLTLPVKFRRAPAVLPLPRA